MLAIRIKELRLKKKLTMLQLGKMLHIGESAISLYESGKRQPSYDVLINLSKIFDVSVDYLLGNTDNPVTIEQFQNASTPPDTKKAPPTPEEALKILADTENLSDESIKYLRDTIDLLKIKEIHKRTIEIDDDERAEIEAEIISEIDDDVNIKARDSLFKKMKQYYAENVKPYAALDGDTDNLDEVVKLFNETTE